MTGNELRYKLKESGVPFNELSERLGISPQHLQSKLKSKNITLEFLIDVAKAINKSIYYFLPDNKQDAHLNAHPSAHLNHKTSLNQENDLLNDVKEEYDSKGNVLLVPVKARAGYLAGYGDPEYIETLEYFKIPGCRHGEYRMFEVDGDSMYPALKHGDYAVGRVITDCCQIKSGTIYIIVCKEEGIIIKRIVNNPKYQGKIIANSDNENQQLYPPLIIQGSEILECWELYKVITGPPEMHPFIIRMSKIEKELTELKKSFNKK